MPASTKCSVSEPYGTGVSPRRPTMSDGANEMVEAAVAHLELSPYTYRADDDADWMTLNGQWNIREMLAAALAAAPAVQGYVLCGGHHVSPAGHCYLHGSRFCGDPACGPCAGPFQDLIARRRARGTP
jgi:hypothetical protein